MQSEKQIYWHEGLFLRPQHFQQLDEHCRSEIQNRMEMIEPHQWGLNSMSIVHAAIANQVIEISNIDIIFQDGSRINYPGNCVIPRRDIVNLWDEAGKPMSIYLGLRKKIYGKNNVDLDVNTVADKPPGAVARYSLSEHGVNVADLYADDKFNNLLFLDYQIQIFVDAEIEKSANHYFIKVAEVTRESGQVRLSTTFIPPLLRISHNPLFMSLIRRCYEQTVTLIRRLNVNAHAQNKILKNNGQLKELLILQTLNRYSPLLDEFLVNPCARPYKVYIMLRQFISEIKNSPCIEDEFRKEYSESDINYRYDHNSIYPIISEMTTELSNIFRRIISSPEQIISLIFDGTYYSVDLVDANRLSSSNVYISVKSGIDFRQVTHIFESLSKMSSRQQLPMLISQSLNTTDLVYQTEPDPRLPRYNNLHYFRVNKNSRAWEAVIDDKNVAIYLDSDFERCQINLVLLHD